MLLDALKFGLGNQGGYSIPIRGGPQGGQFAVFTMNTRCDDADWEEFIRENGRDLMIFAHEFNKKALNFEQGGEGLATPPTLSPPRELAAMSCLAKGMNRAQAAVELGISEHTLRVYIEAARHKLGGALNTTHAVARALSSGIIIV